MINYFIVFVFMKMLTSTILLSLEDLISVIICSIITSILL